MEQTYTGGNSEDFLYVQIHDYTAGGEVVTLTYGDGPPRQTWLEGVSVDLSSRHGHTIEVIFKAFNGDATYPANFWVDDVSLRITQ